MSEERRHTLVVLRIHNRIFKYPNKPIFKDVLIKQRHNYANSTVERTVILTQ